MSDTPETPEPAPEPPKTAKERLLERGQWAAYEACVYELKKMGLPEKFARKRALGRFFSEEELIDLGLNEKKTGVAKAEDDDGEEEEVVSGRKKFPAPIYVDIKVFEGKECSEIENIRWVGKVMGMYGVKPNSAPSAAALNLLNHCRDDPEFRKTFWSSMYVKAIRPEKKDDGEEKEGDGAKTVRLCDRLLETSNSLKGGAEV